LNTNRWSLTWKGCADEDRMGEVKFWQVGLGALLLVAVGAAGGFIAGRQWDIREERLAERWVLAERALKDCQEMERRIALLPGGNRIVEGAGIVPSPRLICERETMERDIAGTAIEMVQRRAR
jgi:hypothetical protein